MIKKDALTNVDNLPKLRWKPEKNIWCKKKDDPKKENMKAGEGATLPNYVPALRSKFSNH